MLQAEFVLSFFRFLGMKNFNLERSSNDQTTQIDTEMQEDIGEIFDILDGVFYMDEEGNRKM